MNAGTDLRGKTVSIKTDAYLRGKYGNTAEIHGVVEDTDTAVFGSRWFRMSGNPAAMLYAMRAGVSEREMNITHGITWYVKIGGLGELIHESEITGIAGVDYDRLIKDEDEDEEENEEAERVGEGIESSAASSGTD